MKKNDIYKTLLGRIVNLQYKPGEILNEQLLCQEFNVSRTPIREVLMQLADFDFVTIKPKVATTVSEIDWRMLKYLYEIKTPLEGLACELAGTRVTPEEIQQLESIVEELRTFSKNGKKTFAYYHDKDSEFHTICHRASRNQFVEKYLAEINLKSRRFLHYIDYKIDELDWYTETLNSILESLKDHDGERAKQEVINHNQSFLKKLSEYFFG